jgi:hypothetical protein
MIAWPKEELRKIVQADDMRIAPFGEDGMTCSTPTWILSVEVDDAIYVRSYNGQESRWYQAAVRQKAGRIQAAGRIIEVAFEPVDGAGDEPINLRIDDAFREKYSRSPYLSAMTGKRARAATVKIMPREIGL